MTAQELIARAHFNEEKAQMLEGCRANNGHRSFRKWPAEERASFRAIERMTWERLEQRDRDRHLRTADISLGALAALTAIGKEPA